MAVDVYAARLDRLSLSRFHWKLLLVAGIGWMFDAFDILVVGSVVAAVASLWSLDTAGRTLILTATPAGMFVGAALAGVLADRFGRKALFQATLLAYSILTGLSALAFNVPSLAIARFLAGIGLGGELPVASTLVSEFAPSHRRGFMVVLLESFWAYGSVLAALVGFLFIPAFGWQAAFLIGALPALYVFILRRSIPESPRYLLSQGRASEAEAVVRQIELESGSTPGSSEVAKTPPPLPRVTLGQLFAGGFATRTITLWVMWFTIAFSYYGIFLWLPSLLSSKGFGVQEAFRLNLVISIFQIPGYFTAAYLVDRWGRKATLVTFLLLNAVGAFFFAEQSLSAQPDIGQILLWGAVMAFFNLGAWGVVYTYTPELYPTRLRGTGAGCAAAVGRLGSILGPFMVGSLLAAFGGSQYAVFIAFTAILIIGGLVVLALGEETKGRTLEQISGV